MLIIGGMGYFGCILSDLLKNEGFTIDIVDCCFFENDNISINYNNFYNTNIINFQIEKEYDLVVWCSDIDIDEFYRYDIFENYVEAYIEKFKEICNTNEVIYITSFKSLISEVNSIEFPSYKRFLQRMKSVMNENTKMFYLGSLYGPSPRMRWDTHINSIFYNFIVNECCILSDNWLQEFPCCNVVSAASYVKDFISGNNFHHDTKNHYVFSEIVNLLELAHRIRICVETGKEHYPIFTSRYDYNKYILNYDECMIKGISIEDSITHFIKELESKHLPDFENDKYNNGIMFNILEKSFKMFDKMNWLKNDKNKDKDK